MEKEIKTVPSEELAYWLGVAQSDGSLVKYLRKGRTEPNYKISLEVAKNSMPMITKFTELSKELFRRKSAIWKTKRGGFSMHIGITGLIEIFKDLDMIFKDPPKPPYWCSGGKLFGAYLAGLIDGVSLVS